MADPKHLEMIKKGSRAWNQWRQENPGIEPDLADVDLRQANLSAANLAETDFRQADLRNANFQRANLIRADLRGANLGMASFNLANLSETNLSEAYLGGADLSQADLRKAYLVKAEFFRADLCEADLRKADFRWAHLSGTDLSRADLREANLRGVHLVEANLSEADLSRANLMEANLSRADLTRTNFNESLMGWSYFGDVDLSQANRIYTVKHYGPSTVGIDTIYRSGGKIQAAFLRGAGVPEKFIAWAAALDEKDFITPNCAISCADKDRDFAIRLQQGLQANAVPCWLVPEQMKISPREPSLDYRPPRIPGALLLVLSEKSISSPWVEKEIQAAVEEERKRKLTLLLPVRLDEAVINCGQPWAAGLLDSRLVHDFSQWRQAEIFDKMFKRLLNEFKLQD